MKISKSFLGSELVIDIKDNNIDKQVIEKCFLKVEIFEKKYSRFIKGNFLYNLNINKESLIDGDLYSMLNLALNVSELTGGYFDITVLPILENMGYGNIYIEFKNNIGYKNIKLDKNKVILENNICIDLGALGKGYILDIINNILSNYYNKYIINFGGDIICKGKHKIGLENPNDSSKIIGEIILDNGSISSSSGVKRIFNNCHHIINPYNRKSENNKIAIYVIHKYAIFSDVFSTALFVSPLKLSLQILKNTNGLEGLLITKEGSIYKSDGFDSILY